MKTFFTRERLFLLGAILLFLLLACWISPRLALFALLIMLVLGTIYGCYWFWFVRNHQ